MKAVLISQRLVGNDTYPETRACLDENWGAFLASLDLLPVPLLPGVEAVHYVNTLQPVGIILSGGNDLSALNDDPLSRQRDQQEGQLLELARERGLPLLGVCRGMQFLAWRLGFFVKRKAGHVGQNHRLIADETGHFRSLLDRPAGVNSYHNHVLNEMNHREFRVSARAEDGTIEALEQVDGRVLGIMWHPERNRPFEAADGRLLRTFFNCG